MEGKTIKANMSKGLWEHGYTPDCVITKTMPENNPMSEESLKYYGGFVIGESMTTANAAAIVSAVNNTWGKGYDPSAMEQLYKALQDAKQTIRDLHGEEVWDIYDKHSPEMKRINAALAAATL